MDLVQHVPKALAQLSAAVCVVEHLHIGGRPTHFEGSSPNCDKVEQQGVDASTHSCKLSAGLVVKLRSGASAMT